MRLFHDQWRMFWLTQAAMAVVAGAVCALLVGGSAWLTEAAKQTDQLLADETAAPGHDGVFRTRGDWTAREAMGTPQFYILLAAYFAHLLIGATVAADSVAHLTERGVSAFIALSMLSLEALMQAVGRSLGGLIGDRIDPRYLLILALAALATGSAALGLAASYPLMLLYAAGSGLGFGLTLLSVSVLLLNYYGRRHNLEIFSITCLIGAVSALGPTIGGQLRDLTGSFTSTYLIFAAVIVAILVAVIFMRPPQRTPDVESL